MNKYFNEQKIEELYPGAGKYMTPAMLINKGTQEKIEEAIDSGDYYAELKKDGAWYEFVKGDNGEKYLFSRQVSKKTGLLVEKGQCVPHILEALDCFPNGTVIIGEIYYPGGSSKDTVSVMGSLPERAIEVQKERGEIHFYIHDMLFLEGCNLMNNPAFSRKYALADHYNKYNLLSYDFIELAPHYLDDLDKVIKNAFDNGEEGVVLKNMNAIYEPDKRPMTNLKVKKSDTFDAIIIGFEEPTKEYYGKELSNWQYYKDGIPVCKAYYMGWTNSRIVLGAYDGNGTIVKIGTIASGIGDELKEDMTKDPYKYLYHVCEVQCMEVDKKAHTLRHGFFVRVRDDKNKEDCTIEEIFR